MRGVFTALGFESDVACGLQFTTQALDACVFGSVRGRQWRPWARVRSLGLLSLHPVSHLGSLGAHVRLVLPAPRSSGSGCRPGLALCVQAPKPVRSL